MPGIYIRDLGQFRVDDGGRRSDHSGVPLRPYGLYGRLSLPSPLGYIDARSGDNQAHAYSPTTIRPLSGPITQSAPTSSCRRQIPSRTQFSAGVEDVENLI